MTQVTNVRHFHKLAATTDLTALGWDACKAMLHDEADAEMIRSRFLDALADAGVSEALLIVAARAGVLPVGRDAGEVVNG